MILTMISIILGTILFAVGMPLWIYILWIMLSFGFATNQ